MKKIKFLSTFMMVCLLISGFLCNAYALEQQSFEIYARENNITNIPEDELIKLRKFGVVEEEILSLSQQIEIYNPTKIQVENYIQSLLDDKDGLSVSQKPIDYKKTESGDSITLYGIIPYYDLVQKWNTSSNLRAVSTLSDVTNSSDQTGVYYSVRSTAGHNQMTSYATLPSLSSVDSNDRPYQMFTFRTSNNKDAYGDIGLVYFPGTGWKGFYNVVEDGDRYENYSINFYGGSNLYMHVQFHDASEKNYSVDTVILTIKDASTWSNAAKEIKYEFVTDCVDSTFSTTKIAKEVTLAQHNDGTLDINSGTIMSNAQYSQTYLYTPSTYYQFNSSYCSEAYRQGPTDSAYEKVHPTYIPWTIDEVDISFN